MTWRRRTLINQDAQEMVTGYVDSRICACGASANYHDSPDFGVFLGCAKTGCKRYAERGSVVNRIAEWCATNGIKAANLETMTDFVRGAVAEQSECRSKVDAGTWALAVSRLRELESGDRKAA